MTELLPLSQSAALRAAILEYLGTTFSLTDAATRSALEEFLTDPAGGLFRGPYVRLRLPFRPAADGWRRHFDWYAGFPPYGHQAAAFARLTSRDPATGAFRRPEPTLVTTGTGSGKTEAFLYPILDHVRRAKRAGTAGMKALILYPMNALANDQAGRLATLLNADPELAGITAALYTGQSGPTRSRVTADGLITDRTVIRDTPPDILLTNYKMLDQLLLRAADARLWEASATSLQYLVLDEFHTYDGAQGTDVAMLLRRLGLTLDAHRGVSSPWHSSRWHNVLGALTPVATSATLGGKGDPEAMRIFATTVFGEDFPPEAVITESRLSYTEWTANDSPPDGLIPIDQDPTAAAQLVDAAAAAAARAPDDTDALCRAVVAHLYRSQPPQASSEDPPLASWPLPDLAGASREELALLLRRHPAVQRLVEETPETRSLSELATRNSPEAYLTAVVSALSHLRKTLGLAMANVEVQMWVRELTRIGRAAAHTARFRWEDDGPPADPEHSGAPTPYFPAIYCRHCGRSGWMVLLTPTGTNVEPSGKAVRRRHLSRDERIRPLIFAPGEDTAAPAEHHPNLRWFRVEENQISSQRPDSTDQDGQTVLPVLTHSLSSDGGTPSKDDVCPACGERDAIRFLGSAISTLLSVTLSNYFGTPYLDAAERKALVFTDSVQDAAYRAGFIQARSHALTLRALIRHALGESPADLVSLTGALVRAAGNDAGARYRLLPPELAEREYFADYWHKPTHNNARIVQRIERRLNLDVALEFGLRSGLGRTLENTGTAVAQVDVPAAAAVRAAHNALAGLDPAALPGLETTDATLLAWVRGVVEHMRHRGAIRHPWLERFCRSDGNRWWITGGRKREQGMPGFGSGVSAPSFPRVGGTPARDNGLEPVTSSKGWYVSWTQRCLHLENQDGATAVRALLKHLADEGVIGEARTDSGGMTYHLEPQNVLVSPATHPTTTPLVCSVCGAVTPASSTVVRELTGAPCLMAFCEGNLEPGTPVAENYYQRMYSVSAPARIVAREHTSLLEDKVRVQYETQFKAAHPAPDAPNVLVATPTLEMGIDIGDLSAVMLSSIPRTVASYLQRIGRAGRLTGNSLVLSFVTARGDHLPLFHDPLQVINGAVRPPATYLDAEEILRRQYLASLGDRLARNEEIEPPLTVPDVLSSVEPGTYLGELIDRAEDPTSGTLDAFLATLPTMAAAVRERLRSWVERADRETRLTSAAAQRVLHAVQDWAQELEELQHQQQTITAAMPALEQKAALEQGDDSHEQRDALRTARSGLRLVNARIAHLNGEYWISALEAAGLFPNYTLIDDSVRLDVSLSWINPETGDFVNEEMSLERGTANALTDFAPGSTFYARGYAVEIDAVDLGRDGQDVHTWACCPRCGFVHDLTASAGTAPSACPRCGASGLADQAQRLRVLPLKRVSSVAKREEAVIDDRHEDRVRESFDVLLLADIDPAAATSWFAEDLGFGARYLPQLPLHWLNLGRAFERGEELELGGATVNAAKFRVCAGCGKLDEKHGENSSRQHRPWCRYRNQPTENNVSIVLGRQLITEGVALRIPARYVLGSSMAKPSLEAALLLALRERLGGSPDHLRVASVKDPSRTGDNAEALLIYDTVPGGTGYLAELASAPQVWTMLHRAWEVLRDCPCQDEGRLACERCLLPYTTPASISFTSRAEAEAVLRAILSGETHDAAEVPAQMPWVVTTEEPAPAEPESMLEAFFRSKLRERLTNMGATITEHPGARGSAWTFRLGTRTWRMEPQVDVLGTRPDFLLTCDDTNVPPTAIYTDGWAYHAYPATSRNRLADDATKREILRQAGYQVIALTWQELREPTHEQWPDWVNPDAIGPLVQNSDAGISPAAISLVPRTAFENVVAWLDRPAAAERSRLADALPFLLWNRLEPLPSSAEAYSAANLAVHAENPSAIPPGPLATAKWHKDTLTLVVRQLPTGQAEFAAVLDDRPAALGEDHRETWAAWLHIANLLNFRTAPTQVTTLSLASATPGPLAPAADGAPGAAAELPAAWAELYEEATQEERPFIADFAQAGIQEIPVPFFEVDDDGTAIDFAWPNHHIAFILDADAQRRERLEALHWRVVTDVDHLTQLLATEEES